MTNLIFAREHKNRDTLYLQIAAGLRRSIAQGQFSAGEQLPSIADMARDLSVSIVTVRSAIAVLEDEGLVERYQGKGTFIASDLKTATGLVLNSGFHSLLDHLAGKTTRILETSEAGVLPMIDPGLGKLSERYHYMRRVHLAENVPYALINIQIDHDIYEQARDRFDNSMVIPILAELADIQSGKMHQTISFTTADPDTAQHLEVPINSAIGNVLRVITDKHDRVIYVGQTKYRGDFVRLEMSFDHLDTETTGY